MRRYIVRVPLSEAGFSNAARWIRTYRTNLKDRTERLEQRIADEIKADARERFASSIYDDLIRDGYRAPNVDVTVTTDGNYHMVIADGEEAIFVEFGAGVFHNGAVGSSPHPLGAEMGFTIGSYGENGAKNAWGFIGEDGALHITRGTKAQMPLYLAVRSVIERIPQIAREVFGSD